MLKIQIIGETATGKTTLALLLEAALLDAGIACIVRDRDVEENTQLEHLQLDRVRALANKSKTSPLVVETVYVK